MNLLQTLSDSIVSLDWGESFMILVPSTIIIFVILGVFIIIKIIVKYDNNNNQPQLLPFILLNAYE